VVLPIIGPSVVGIGLFGFTLSWDEIARTSQAVGYLNTLPLGYRDRQPRLPRPSSVRWGR
jgi:putative spermidine/putrescine transport system permease protein